MTEENGNVRVLTVLSERMRTDPTDEGTQIAFIIEGTVLVRSCAAMASDIHRDMQTVAMGELNGYDRMAKALVEILADPEISAYARVSIVKTNSDFVARLAEIPAVTSVQRAEIRRMVQGEKEIGKVSGMMERVWPKPQEPRPVGRRHALRC